MTLGTSRWNVRVRRRHGMVVSPIQMQVDETFWCFSGAVNSGSDARRPGCTTTMRRRVTAAWTGQCIEQYVMAGIEEPDRGGHSFRIQSCEPICRRETGDSSPQSPRWLPERPGGPSLYIRLLGKMSKRAKRIGLGC